MVCPVGTGKGMLISCPGGIDSPVAGYLALKRGVDIEGCSLCLALHTQVQVPQESPGLNP